MFCPDIKQSSTALYVETNLSAGSIVQLVNSLLEGLGYPTDLMAVELQQ